MHRLQAILTARTAMKKKAQADSDYKPRTVWVEIEPDALHKASLKWARTEVCERERERE